MTDQEIITHLKEDTTAHDLALVALYQHPIYRARAYSHMGTKGVDQQDLSTIWTDVVIQFGHLVRTGKYKHQGHLSGYVLNLCQYMTLNHFRAKRKDQRINTTDMPELGFEEVMVEDKELKGLISRFLDQLGGVCKEVLYLWSMSYSMQEIVERLSLKSTAAARKRKHDCLKRLSKNMENTQVYQELLNSYQS